jgi:hypothetical protein
MQKRTSNKDRQADAIEITPEMIEAGVAVLWASGAVDEKMGADRLLVSEIFRAMAQEVPLVVAGEQDTCSSGEG